ncbi:hypothetical protein HHK36_016846 [Tetracentron sinense]|uniref:AB hydrolase-1 domain-containing protein n=1 Tax=Tetracentron sinense TaxID=13715 RepID=A0A834Z220_TETSI|nr:hypothetical protein HHK36_016846 [Tetracentron sinense]
MARSLRNPRFLFPTRFLDISKSLSNGISRSLETLAYEEIRVTSEKPYNSTAFVLHGLLGSGRNWKSFSRNLASTLSNSSSSADWRLVLVDLRNHGRSAELKGLQPPHDMVNAAKDLANLVKSQGWAWPDVVIGHSMGGKVALQFAESCARGDYGESAALPKQVYLHQLSCSLHVGFNVLRNMNALLTKTVSRWLRYSDYRGQRVKSSWPLDRNQEMWSISSRPSDRSENIGVVRGFVLLMVSIKESKCVYEGYEAETISFRELKRLQELVNVPTNWKEFVIGGKILFGRKFGFLGSEQLWVLDSVPGEVNPEVDGEVEKVLRTLQSLPSSIPSRKWLVDNMIQLGFSKPLSEWIGSNLKKSGENETWAFDLKGAVEMFSSYREKSYWPLLDHPPKGLEITIVRAENSDRWSSDVVQQLESLASRRRDGSVGKVSVHVLPNSGHWVHMDNPKGLLDILAPSIISMT